MKTKEQTLATYAVTGVLDGTFTVDALDDVARLAALAEAVSPELVAKTALFARARGRRRVAAILVACLTAIDVRLMERAFARVIDDGKALLTFCEVVRSGTLRRKSFGSAPKRAVRAWFASRSPEAIFRQSFGRSPSMSDVIKMVRPPPRRASRSPTGENDQGEADAAREALYGYLVGKNVDDSRLPPLARALEAYERATDERTAPVPDLPLEMLTARPLRARHWTDLARKMTFAQLGEHLSSLVRHGVLDEASVARHVAERLSDEAAIARSPAAPFALAKTLAAVRDRAPDAVVDALARAIAIARANVARVDAGAVVHVDRSGSMLATAAGAMRCADVAALVADVYRRDETDDPEVAIVVSDREASSIETVPARRRVLVDLRPRTPAAAPTSDDVLVVAGFSDEVFDVVAAFARGDLDGDRWLEAIAREPV